MVTTGTGSAGAATGTGQTRQSHCLGRDDRIRDHVQASLPELEAAHLGMRLMSNAGMKELGSGVSTVSSHKRDSEGAIPSM